jgi:hypothetical protein
MPTVCAVAPGYIAKHQAAANATSMLADKAINAAKNVEKTESLLSTLIELS